MRTPLHPITSSKLSLTSRSCSLVTAFLSEPRFFWPAVVAFPLQRRSVHVVMRKLARANRAAATAATTANGGTASKTETIETKMSTARRRKFERALESPANGTGTGSQVDGGGAGVPAGERSSDGAPTRMDTSCAGGTVCNVEGETAKKTRVHEVVPQRAAQTGLGVGARVNGRAGAGAGAGAGADTECSLIEPRELLIQKHVQLLKSADLPLDDASYLDVCEFLLVIRDKIIQGEQDLFSNPCRVPLDTVRPPDHQKARDLLQRLYRLEDHAQDVLSRRLAATRERGGNERWRLPRVERVFDALGIAQSGRIGLFFVLLHYTGKAFPPPDSNYHSRGMGRNLRLYSRMSDIEYFDFISKQNPLVKEGILEIRHDEYEPDHNNIQLKIPVAALKALCGGTLTDDEYLTLDKTQLASIISEEPSSPFHVSSRSEHQHKSHQDASAARAPNVPSRVAASTASPRESDELHDHPGNDDDGVGDAGHDAMAATDLAALLHEVEATLEATNSLPEDATGGETPGAETGAEVVAGELDREGNLKPYTNDLDYLEDSFAVVELRLRLFNASKDDGEAMFMRSDKRTPDLIIRELKAKVRHAVRRKEARLRLTVEAAGSAEKGGWKPRLELLVDRRKYSDFERDVMIALIGAILSQDLRRTMQKMGNSFRGSSDQFDVGTILGMFLDTLAEQVQSRRVFYRNAPLVRDGIIRLSERAFGEAVELTSANVSIDKRMLDFCAGLNTELSDMMEGGQCYTPTISVDQVVLPEEQKRRICDSFRSFERYRAVRRTVGFQDGLTDGSGMVALFHGPPGTGKTMMANAVAGMLGLKVVLVAPNNPALTSDPSLLRSIFREALLVGAVLVFDECEAVFASRDRGATTVNHLLVEIEKFDGIAIMCTNRPADIDEAMHRRITMACKFNEPDPDHRELIWKEHIPKELQLDASVDLRRIATDFDLNGGFVKNAVLSALATAVCRDEKDIRITQEDLVTACTGQARSQIGASLFDDDKLVSRKPPSFLQDLVVPDEMLKRLGSATAFENGRRTLSVSWGLGDNVPCCCVVISGPSGSGKHRVAEALGNEIGRTVQRFDCGLLVAAAAAEGKRSIGSVFRDAQNAQKVILVDKAGLLLQILDDDSMEAGKSGANGMRGLALANLGVLCDNIREYRGMVVLLVPTETRARAEMLSEAAARSSWVLWHVPLPQLDRISRELMWKQSVPEGMPIVADDPPDYVKLSEQYPAFGCTQIRNVVCKAAAAALAESASAGGQGVQAGLSMKVLQAIGEDETARSGGRERHHMFT